MKRRISIGYIVISGLIFAWPCFAQDFSHNVRSCGMGNSGIAMVPDDQGRSFIINPAISSFKQKGSVYWGLLMGDQDAAVTSKTVEIGSINEESQDLFCGGGKNVDEFMGLSFYLGSTRKNITTTEAESSSAKRHAVTREDIYLSAAGSYMIIPDRLSFGLSLILWKNFLKEETYYTDNYNFRLSGNSGFKPMACFGMVLAVADNISVGALLNSGAKSENNGMSGRRTYFNGFSQQHAEYFDGLYSTSFPARYGLGISYSMKHSLNVVFNLDYMRTLSGILEIDEYMYSTQRHIEYIEGSDTLRAGVELATPAGRYVLMLRGGFQNSRVDSDTAGDAVLYTLGLGIVSAHFSCDIVLGFDKQRGHDLEFLEGYSDVEPYEATGMIAGLQIDTFF